MKIVTITNDLQGTRIQGAGGIFLIKEGWAKQKRDAAIKATPRTSPKNKKNETH
ncbi:MAG: hypothetical protein QM786_09120 [Breznakibacter sp.]